jgi:hypothetical protein
MKAIITGTPVEIEGEPAEIAALVELLSTGAVMIEHVHRWRISDEKDGIAPAACWCGQQRTFAPYDMENLGFNNAPKPRLVDADVDGPVAATKKRGGKKRGGAGACSNCGQRGHTRRTCGRQGANAAEDAA